MATKRTSKQQTRIWRQTQLSLFLLFIAGGLTGLLGSVLFVHITLDLPDIGSLDSYQPAQTTLIYDHQGVVVDRVFTENRIVVPLDKLPEQLPQAFIAAEDARFYDHSGVDGWSIVRALVHNLRAGERRQGGSTITQQVARALLLSREKTYIRKIREAILAYRIDQKLNKDEILHIYLNHIYLGSGAYGVEAAAWTYFGKPARELNLAETALLAGLPQAPSRYTPFRDYTAAKRRQAYVLNRMAEEAYITPTAARRAYLHPLLWASPRQNGQENSYFLQQVRNQIEQTYGRNMLYNGGLRVYTGLDQELQQRAAAAVTLGVQNWERRQRRAAAQQEQPQAALLAMETGSGLVRAVSGGTDFSVSQFNRATQARRQPGSAFKPIIYAAALDHGMTPASVIIDEPLRLPGADRGRVWEPKNFSNRFYGPTTLRDGLVYSRNILSVKIMQEIGLAPVVKLARQMGISSPLSNNLSLALGSAEISVMELTAAYGALANGGVYHAPVFIKSVRDSNGRVLEQANLKGQRALDERTAYQVTRLLEGVVREGTGRSVAAIGLPVAGKTGTTDRYMDAWFIGYSPELVTGVWMGFDRARPLGRNESGARAAAPIWLHFMQGAKAQLAGKEFPRPPGIVLVPIDHAVGHFEEETPNRVSLEAFRIDNLPPALLSPAPAAETPRLKKLQEMPAEG
ncbi:penicillin-binding protein 1A [Desulfurivibrio alkaliphilus]|uniref:peptidoglycan glycosyltransferase n=1 Tax=Desulfurivibrio alkaliphilus (strain DSM 19089 / UNIQEM U267 / AHT2) TaxID=589865 RepID=D6Z6J8_DESAT|nr:PBP1A family penicillin-binding protein [Desulfurivibrio alkaliphilus]ADH84957.1 penicillin-binding protein, 1A family [Desulfurivibrio alkaliphilus AHT 2]